MYVALLILMFQIIPSALPPERFVPVNSVVQMQYVGTIVEKDVPKYTFKILRVYSGSLRMKGEIFSLVVPKFPIQGSPVFPEFLTPVTESEISIVLLEYDANLKLVLAPLRGKPGIIVFPARNIKTYPRFKQAEEWAIAVESVAKRKVEDRPAVLRDLALNKTPEVAAWAVEALAADDSDKTKQFLNELSTRKGVSAHAFIALDNLYSSRNEKTWTNKLRVEMFQETTQTDDEFELLGTMNFLQRHASTTGGFPADKALSLVAAIASNEHLSATFRNRACLGVRVIAHSGLVEAGFDALLYRVKSDPDKVVRVYAAYQIGELIDSSEDFGRKPTRLSAEQLERLRKHMKQEKDKAIVEAFEGVLERAKKNELEKKDPSQ